MMMTEVSVRRRLDWIRRSSRRRRAETFNLCSSSELNSKFIYLVARRTPIFRPSLGSTSSKAKTLGVNNDSHGHGRKQINTEMRPETRSAGYDYDADSMDEVV
jgi:hypothetical protein